MKGFVTEVSSVIEINSMFYTLFTCVSCLQIKDQGSCSSSWAFSATGALEGQLYKSTRQQVSLSEQQLLDCSINYGNKGCSGGVATNAFMYVARSGGICRESAYPYLGYVSRQRLSHTGSMHAHIEVEQSLSRCTTVQIAIAPVPFPVQASPSYPLAVKILY